MAVHAVQSQQNGGDLPYKSTQINKYYADYVHKTKATIPLEHKPGETIQLDRQEAELLFRLISERYEHGSIILTSNKYFSDWGELLSDNILATALLDRLLHHAHVVNIRGQTYRLRERWKAGVQPVPPAELPADN